MSSWVSHYPAEIPLGRVAGLGMNAAELSANPRLTEHCVHDLNLEPELPFDAAAFDRATIAVSIQYLVRPVETMQSVARVLRPGGRLGIAVSHRMFPTKAVRAFHQLPPAERVRLVGAYLVLGGFENVAYVDRSPSAGDPLWILAGETAGSLSSRSPSGAGRGSPPIQPVSGNSSAHRSGDGRSNHPRVCEDFRHLSQTRGRFH